MGLDLILLTLGQPAQHGGRAGGGVRRQRGGIEAKSIHRSVDHRPRRAGFGLAHGAGCFDIDDDRVVGVDEVVVGKAKKARPFSALVH